MRPMDESDRKFFAGHFQAIADRMEEIGLVRGNAWQVESPKGRVYQFRCVRSYARRGTVADQEERTLLDGADRAGEQRNAE